MITQLPEPTANYLAQALSDVCAGCLVDVPVVDLLKRVEITMLRAIVAVFLILWLLGVVLHVAGSLIHLLVLAALIIFIFDLLGRRRVRA
jgi:uncharacterized protein DUF5670